MWKSIFLILCLTCSITLNAKTKVLAFSGTISEVSANQQLITQAAEIAKELDGDVKLINLRDYPLPIFNPELEAKFGRPESAKELQKLMIEADVILIASPEYNASITALLKNTIDWMSRSDQNGPSNVAFAGKKFGLMSASPSPCGGIRGLMALELIILDLNGIVIPSTVTVGDAYNAFNTNGKLKSGTTEQKLKTLIKNTLVFKNS